MIVRIGSVEAGAGRPLFLIGGPDVIEGEAHALRHARAIRDVCAELKVPYIYKSSYDKANRTSGRSFRGPGLKAGLRILAKVARVAKVPVLTDVHSPEEARAAARSVDVLQIPAFLCRQTDLLIAAAKTGRVVNVKKGQFLAPWDMKNVVDKARATGNDRILVCERGVSFGYNNLVSDMRALSVMRATGCPVVFDATHSVQLPGGQGDKSGGQREFVPVLARAAVAAGVAGVFMETHPNPDQALSDGPNAWPLGHLRELLTTLVQIDRLVKSGAFAEDLV